MEYVTRGALHAWRVLHEGLGAYIEIRDREVTSQQGKAMIDSLCIIVPIYSYPSSFCLVGLQTSVVSPPT